MRDATILSMKLIDLTHSFTDKMPAFPGDLQLHSQLGSTK